MLQNIIIVSGGYLGKRAFFERRAALTENRWFVASDGGAKHLRALGLTPDVIIGDMDSLPADHLADYERQGITIIRHPVNKDYTDTALALDYALGLHPAAIEIWGALGGRIDHALANIHMLIRGKEAGISTRLVDEYAETSIAGEEIRFDDAVGCLVSLIAMTPVVEDITLDGFEYALTHECLTMGESRGISNIIAASPASIRAGSGNLLVVRYWRKDVLPEVL